MKNVMFSLVLLAASTSLALAQNRATASRVGDLQIGGGFSSSQNKYLNSRINGFNFYTDFDFRPHWGVEVNFHQLNDRSGSKVYERTYEFGGRYVGHYGGGFFNPYVKGLYGRGVYNFNFDAANLAYNMLVGGAGADFAVHPRANVRIDYEYQHWLGFQFQGLNPQVITVGAAYHFGPGKPH